MENDIVRKGETLCLDEQQRETLRKLGGLGWPEKEICDCMGFDPAWFHQQWTDSGSEISRLVRQGGLQERAKMEIKVFSDAQGGDADALEQFRHITRDRSFSISKLDLYGGSSDIGAFTRLRNYMERGDKEGLTDKEAVYFDLLSMVHSLDLRLGKRKAIQVLTSSPFDFTYDRASNVYAEAIELFYADRNVSRDALRAKAADQFDALYHLAMEAAKTPKDYEIAAGILAQKAKLQRLDKEDPAVLPEAGYAKQYRLLSITAESIGLPSANRDELAAQIDSLIDVPEAEKNRLRMEAGIKDLDIIKVLENGVSEEGA